MLLSHCPRPHEDCDLWSRAGISEGDKWRTAADHPPPSCARRPGVLYFSVHHSYLHLLVPQDRISILLGETASSGVTCKCQTLSWRRACSLFRSDSAASIACHSRQRSAGARQQNTGWTSFHHLCTF